MPPNPNAFERLVIKHFKKTKQKGVVRALEKCRDNFFEGWFLGELVSLLKNTKLYINMNFCGYKRVDLAFVKRNRAFVYELKHINTDHTQANGRWDGTKESTVAKDWQKLTQHRSDRNSERGLLVFIGPCEDPGRNHIIAGRKTFRFTAISGTRLPIVRKITKSTYLLIFKISSR